MDVYGARDQTLVEADECRPAPALRDCRVAFTQPFFREKWLDDLRNGASLQPRLPGELGARDWLTCPNQLEHDAAVDAPRRAARGELDIRQIDAANLRRALALFIVVVPSPPDCSMARASPRSVRGG
jgi:hypothetical protein